MGGGPAAPPRSSAENAAIPWWADAAVDVGSAAASAFCVAPFITIVDMAVTKASAGQASLARAVFEGASQLLLRPHRFFSQPSVWMVAGVYGSTYMAANLIDSTCERALDRSDPSSATNHGAAKLVGTTVVNMSAGITKDTAFARMYGAGKAAAPMPKATIGLFATRDLFTIGAAFTVPPLLASFFIRSGLVEEKYAAETAQLVSPVAMQVFCSPLHLMALNFYNVRDSTAGQRLKQVASTLPQTTIARMCRMAPAYGLGGVMNTTLVHRGRDRNLREYYTTPQDSVDKTLDSASALPPPPPRRRRLVNSLSKLEQAMDLLGGDASPDAVESAESGGSQLLRRHSSFSLAEPASVGYYAYYPELAALAERKLGLEEERNPLVGLLGDSREVPDMDAGLAKKLQARAKEESGPKSGPAGGQSSPR